LIRVLAMFEIAPAFPAPANEPILSYAPGSQERAALKDALAKLGSETPDIPHVIGGKALYDGSSFDVRAPHKKTKLIARAHNGGEAMGKLAIDAAQRAAASWAETPFEERARIFLRMADLLAGPWRQTLNAATMLGQSKTVYQAEIDAACELVDFLRFNVRYASALIEQPFSLRPLEGFVLAITPFNFTAIAANLPAAPALLGNVVVWKPAETQSLAAYHTMRLFQAAGLPDGVINLVHGEGAPIADVAVASTHLAGVHFTGSTRVFQQLWRAVGERISSYKTFPRLVGETGGKDFVFAHASANVEGLAVALVRGAFEYQGQKCSAASRAYIPESIWSRVRERCLALIESIRMGDVEDFQNFMGAVIDERAYNRLADRIDRATHDPSCKVLASKLSRDEGWFVGPTLIEVSAPNHGLMTDELFGPLLAIFVYADARLEETLALCDATSAYALTGAIWAEDRKALSHAARVLRQAAGNLYLNDKPTGATVGQQPFGGGRNSGTNDKAGSAVNLLRWASPRTVKENFVPPMSIEYPSMQQA
jgi:1-pyrroline-5-carboxylate dehydrogenase